MLLITDINLGIPTIGPNIDNGKNQYNIKQMMYDVCKTS